jgi:hypothetical protein
MADEHSTKGPDLVVGHSEHSTHAAETVTCGDYVQAVQDGHDNALKRRERLATLEEVQEKIDDMLLDDDVDVATLAKIEALLSNMTKKARSA